MKKFISLALALAMTLTLAACGSKTEAPADTSGNSQQEAPAQTGGKLVVYSALNEDNTIAIADQFKKGHRH